MWLVIVSGLLAGPVAAQDKQILIVQLQGKAIGMTRPIPQVPDTGTIQGNCFDVDILGLGDNTAAGTATQCLTDIRTVNGGMALTATTFFRFPNGTVVSRQRTTVQPIIDGTAEMTHITGTIPAPLATNVLAEVGTGKFAGVPGSVRIVGAMNLSNFKDKNEIAFDDIAIIRLTERTAQLREVQRRLQAEGFSPGPIDGVLGTGTRTALSQYQAKHGLPKTGALDDATRKALGVL
jgi:hypothetical protein